MGTDVAENLREVLGNLPDGVQLVAVSKFHPEEYIKAAYAAGQRVFGESHEQELEQKRQVLPQDIRWHFIGHLQTNKVKYIAPYIDMVEAVDTFKLIDILLELHIAAEETKYGFTLDDCRKMLKEGEWRDLKNVRICGLMMMASNVDDKERIRKEMQTAADFFDELKHDYFTDADYFKERSWGMSHDYLIAVECRSTMVRIGTSIFGPRIY